MRLLYCCLLVLGTTVLGNDVNDFYKSGQYDDAEAAIKDQGVMFLDGSTGEGSGHRSRKLAQRAVPLDDEHITIEEVLANRGSARLLSELNGVAALRRELQAEAPVEGPVEAPEEAPAPPVAPPPPPFVDGPAEAPGGALEPSDNDLIVVVTMTWVEGGVTYRSLQNTGFSNAYEAWFYSQFGRAARINTGQSQYATPAGNQFWIAQFPREGRTEATDPLPMRGRSVNPLPGGSRRRLGAEDAQMSDLMYYSSPASDPAGDDTVRILDEVTGIEGRRLQQDVTADSNDGAITRHKLYFPVALWDFSYAATFAAAAGVSELINRAANDPVLLLNILAGIGSDDALKAAALLARQGQTVEINGNDYTLPKVSATAPLTPDGRPADLPGSKSAGITDADFPGGMIALIVVLSTVTVLLVVSLGVIYYKTVVQKKKGGDEEGEEGEAYKAENNVEAGHGATESAPQDPHSDAREQKPALI